MPWLAGKKFDFGPSLYVNKLPVMNGQIRKFGETATRTNPGLVYALPCFKEIGRIDDTEPCTTKGNPRFDYAVACPYNVLGNFGRTEIGHVGPELGLIDVTFIQVDH